MISQNFMKNNPVNFTDVEVLDSVPNVEFSPGFKDTSEINPRSYPVVYENEYDESQRTNDLLERQGYYPKPFCKG